eukprot:437923-Hanusia_phi.AAC.2
MRMIPSGESGMKCIVLLSEDLEVAHLCDGKGRMTYMQAIKDKLRSRGYEFHRHPNFIAVMLHGLEIRFSSNAQLESFFDETQACPRVAPLSLAQERSPWELTRCGSVWTREKGRKKLEDVREVGKGMGVSSERSARSMRVMCDAEVGSRLPREDGCGRRSSAHRLTEGQAGCSRGLSMHHPLSRT